VPISMAAMINEIQHHSPIIHLRSFRGSHTLMGIDNI
jgi:hypothetical protein